MLVDLVGYHWLSNTDLYWIVERRDRRPAKPVMFATRFRIDPADWRYLARFAPHRIAGAGAEIIYVRRETAEQMMELAAAAPDDSLLDGAR